MVITKRQLDWLEARSREIVREKVRIFADALPELPAFDFEAKVAAIRAGKAKLRPTAEMTPSTDLEDAYTYPSAAPLLKKRKDQQEKVRMYEHALSEARTRMLDKAIMGGAKEALDALESFTAQIAKIKA